VPADEQAPFLFHKHNICRYIIKFAGGENFGFSYQPDNDIKVRADIAKNGEILINQEFGVDTNECGDNN
jgi:hypothetical protein